MPESVSRGDVELRPPDPARLREIADWFDAYDRERRIDPHKRDPQRDLRAWANWVDLQDEIRRHLRVLMTDHGGS